MVLQIANCKVPTVLIFIVIEGEEIYEWVILILWECDGWISSLSVTKIAIHNTLKFDEK